MICVEANFPPASARARPRMCERTLSHEPRVASSDSWLVTRDLGPLYSRIASEESRITNGKPTSRDLWLRKSFLISWPYSRGHESRVRDTNRVPHFLSHESRPMTTYGLHTAYGLHNFEWYRLLREILHSKLMNKCAIISVPADGSAQPGSTVSANAVPADTLRYNDVVISSKRRHFDSWLAGLFIVWDLPYNWCIMGSRDRWEFPLIFKCHWQFPCTALCREAVKYEESRLWAEDIGTTGAFQKHTRALKSKRS